MQPVRIWNLADTDKLMRINLGSTASIAGSNVFSKTNSLGLKWNIMAFMRRRLSEFRDNRLSKHPSILAAAKRLQRNILNN
jgi:hypothetical protein